jgi:dTDP-4-dehydrorhamnose 3,5-epimerase
MKILEAKDLELEGVKKITYQRFGDDRGYFTETFRQSDISAVIPSFTVKQTNESYSKKGVVRGLHFQWNPYQGKLVRTVNGHMIDIFLDIRKNSPTFGKIAGLDIPSESTDGIGAWIWLPPGFAHGVVFLEDTTIEYLCTSEYSPGNEAGISPLSKDIDWSLCDKGVKEKVDNIFNNNPIISEKDQAGLTLKQWTNDPRSENFIYGKI